QGSHPLPSGSREPRLQAHAGNHRLRAASATSSGSRIVVSCSEDSSMKKTLALAALAATTLAMPGIGQAQDEQATAPTPRFMVLPPHVVDGVKFPEAPATPLAQWNGSFKDLNGVTRNYTMVGADPKTSNATTTVTVYLIPVK